MQFKLSLQLFLLLNNFFIIFIHFSKLKSPIKLYFCVFKFLNIVVLEQY